MAATEPIPGRIGPNAITRVAETLAEGMTPGEIDAVFAAAGLARYRLAPPERMVDEGEVAALHGHLRSSLPPAQWRQVLWVAGLRTGDYLLANRIPHPAQRLLRLLPAGLAARLLLRAIARHAWTFAGSGSFLAAPGNPVRVAIGGCPLCRGEAAGAPVCDYYAATLQRLFAVLVHPDTLVREVACEATGAAACVFEIGWPARARAMRRQAMLGHPER